MAYEDTATEYAQRYRVLSGCNRIEDTATENYHYPIARSFAGNPSYARYLDTAIAEHVAKGHYSKDHAQHLTTGQLYDGNDGD